MNPYLQNNNAPRVSSDDVARLQRMIQQYENVDNFADDDPEDDLLLGNAILQEKAILKDKISNEDGEALLKSEYMQVQLKGGTEGMDGEQAIAVPVQFTGLKDRVKGAVQKLVNRKNNPPKAQPPRNVTQQPQRVPAQAPQYVPEQEEAAQDNQLELFAPKPLKKFENVSVEDEDDRQMQLGISYADAETILNRLVSMDEELSRVKMQNKEIQAKLTISLEILQRLVKLLSKPKP